ncbi:MAG: IS481 family transposase, partial [Syntrophobacteria bacterium]
KFYQGLEELQDDFDTWLYHYNYERTHLGYRNMGRKPMETFHMTKHLAPERRAA